MARVYKKNRARGTRKSSYRRKFELGFELPKVKNKTVGQYTKELYELNKELIDRAYNEMIEAARKVGGENAAEHAKTQFPTAKEFVKSQFGKNIPTIKKTKKIINLVLAPVSVKQMAHILDLVASDAGFYEELKLRANEELNFNRFTYSGDNVYSYTNKEGKIIRFAFIKYGSPSVLEFLDTGEDYE